MGSMDLYIDEDRRFVGHVASTFLMNHAVFNDNDRWYDAYTPRSSPRVDIDRAPYEEHRSVCFQLRLVHCDLLTIPLRDAARQRTESAHPVVNGDVTGFNHAGLWNVIAR
jgi:hypothetical protein